MTAESVAVRLAGLLLFAATLAQAGEVRRESFRSERLGREVAYTIYRPDLDQRSSAALPLIYLLHGAGGNESSALRAGALAPPLLSALQASGLQHAIIVMPSLGPHTWWIDGAVDAAASALVGELMPRVEALIGAPVQGRRRTVIGISMGGYGALHLALTHSNLFCAAALISPAVYDPLPPSNSAALRSAQFARGGAFDAGLWQAANHPALLAAYRASPNKVAFWIVSGDHDDLGIALQSAQLFERLRAIQPDRTELRIIDGGHDGPTFDAALAPALAFINQRCE